MTFQIGLGKRSNVSGRDVVELDAFRLQLTFDDLDCALPYQGDDQMGVIGSWSVVYRHCDLRFVKNPA
jgi:hypothetical protein